jgi:predicted nucleic acid-binding protein
VIVLDTSVLSTVYRRRAAASSPPPPAAAHLHELIRADVELCVPGIVVQELLSGLKNPADVRRLQDELSGFRLLLADRDTHVAAAGIHTTCAARGVAAATVDCLIAAHAVQVDGALFTLDADFTRIAAHAPLTLHAP